MQHFLGYYVQFFQKFKYPTEIVKQKPETKAFYFTHFKFIRTLMKHS